MEIVAFFAAIPLLHGGAAHGAEVLSAVVLPAIVVIGLLAAAWILYRGRRRGRGPDAEGDR